MRANPPTVALRKNTTPNTEASQPLQPSSAPPHFIAPSLTDPCVYSTDELFKASAYFTDALLPSLDTSLKRPHMTGVFSHNGSTEQPVSASSMSATNTPSLLPPITLASGPVTPTTQSVSRSPLARAQPVIRRLLSRSKLSGANDDRPFPIPVSPPHISTPDIGPVLVPTAFNLSQHTTLPYWSWLETPENSARLARFARAMTGTEGWMGASDTELCGMLIICSIEGAMLLTRCDSVPLSRPGGRLACRRRWWWNRVDDIETCGAVLQVTFYHTGP